MELASAALEASNWKEAESYFTRSLEMDPADPNAWYGKALSAGYQSTLAVERLDEMYAGFRRALELTSDADRPAMKVRAATDLSMVALNFQGVSFRHTFEYVAIDGSWGEHLERSARALSLLERALEWFPDSTGILEAIVDLCKENIEGIAYRDPYDCDSNGTPRQKVHGVSPQYEAQLRSRLDSAAARLRELRPDYQVAAIAKASHSGCVLPFALVLLSAAGLIVSALRLWA